jgi:hypothetical protein
MIVMQTFAQPAMEKAKYIIINLQPMARCAETVKALAMSIE